MRGKKLGMVITSTIGAYFSSLTAIVIWEKNLDGTLAERVLNASGGMAFIVALTLIALALIKISYS